MTSSNFRCRKSLSQHLQNNYSRYLICEPLSRAQSACLKEPPAVAIPGCELKSLSPPEDWPSIVITVQNQYKAKCPGALPASDRVSLLPRLQSNVPTHSDDGCFAGTQQVGPCAESVCGACGVYSPLPCSVDGMLAAAEHPLDGKHGKLPASASE
jgi:hypothetical protein